jgi:Tfp pilus assembly protein PilV
MPIAKCRIGEAHSAFLSSSHSSFEFRHSGFTFIEVLFAVILLGIGFIMIAAVFPVAIQQTSAVSDETQGTALARDAIKKIQQAADSVATADAGSASANTLFPVTGTSAAPNIYAITTTGTGNVNLLTATPASNGLMAALGADSFFTGDHRFGWVGFYRRDSATSPFVQVYVISLQNPNFANYLYPVPTPNQTVVSAAVPPPVPPSAYGYSPPQAAQIQASFYYNTDGSTNIIVSYPMSQQTPNALTGAYALVASGNANMVGRFFRLGIPLGPSAIPSGYTPPNGTTNPQVFQIQPGSDITPADAQVNGFTASTTTAAFTGTVWLMGAAPTVDPAGSGQYIGPFNGPNQDVGVATGFVRINTAKN